MLIMLNCFIFLPWTITSENGADLREDHKVGKNF
jgi:hypothetical protein